MELDSYPSMVPVRLTEHPLRVAEDLSGRLAATSGVSVPAQDLLDSPHVLVGSVDALFEKSSGCAGSWGSAAS